MIVGHAAVVDAIWASRGVAVVMRNYFSGRL